MKKTILLVVALFVSAGVQAADGYKLLKQCDLAIRTMALRLPTTKLDHGNIMHCYGKMQGIIATTFQHRRRFGTALFCPPGSLTAGGAARIVVNYMKARPSVLSGDEIKISISALRQAYPCR